MLRLTAYTSRLRASPFDALMEVPLRMTKVISDISMALDGYVTAPNVCAEAPGARPPGAPGAAEERSRRLSVPTKPAPRAPTG